MDVYLQWIRWGENTHTYRNPTLTEQPAEFLILFLNIEWFFQAWSQDAPLILIVPARFSITMRRVACRAYQDYLTNIIVQSSWLSLWIRKDHTTSATTCFLLMTASTIIITRVAEFHLISQNHFKNAKKRLLFRKIFKFLGVVIGLLKHQFSKSEAAAWFLLSLKS